MHLFVHTDVAKFTLDLPALATASSAATLWIDHYAFEALVSGTDHHFQIEFLPNFVERHWYQYHVETLENVGNPRVIGTHYSSMCPLPTDGQVGFKTWPLGKLPPGTQKVQIHLRDSQGLDLEFDKADLWLRVE
jgi:hypothetical protein